MNKPISERSSRCSRKARQTKEGLVLHLDNVTSVDKILFCQGRRLREQRGSLTDGCGRAWCWMRVKLSMGCPLLQIPPSFASNGFCLQRLLEVKLTFSTDLDVGGQKLFTRVKQSSDLIWRFLMDLSIWARFHTAIRSSPNKQT